MLCLMHKYELRRHRCFSTLTSEPWAAIKWNFWIQSSECFSLQYTFIELEELLWKFEMKSKTHECFTVHRAQSKKHIMMTFNLKKNDGTNYSVWLHLKKCNDILRYSFTSWISNFRSERYFSVSLYSM